MELDDWLDASGGVARRKALLTHGISEAEIKRRVRSGEWRQLYRGVIATHRAPGPPQLDRCRAALVLAGRGAYLSCLGAALHRQLPLPADSPVHVSVPNARAVSAQVGFYAHRDAQPKPPSTFAGLPTVSIEAALIAAFGCLDDRGVRRKLVIESVRERRVMTRRVMSMVTARTARAAELLELLAVCDGSQSEAEIAMLYGVIRAAGLPEPARQHSVRAGGRHYRVDIAYPQSKLAIEVDGRAWHFNAQQRNRDIRRDVELAADGWITLRFTYEQITKDPGWVASRIAEALARRVKITS